MSATEQTSLLAPQEGRHESFFRLVLAPRLAHEARAAGDVALLARLGAVDPETQALTSRHRSEMLAADPFVELRDRRFVAFVRGELQRHKASGWYALVALVAWGVLATAAPCVSVVCELLVASRLLDAVAAGAGLGERAELHGHLLRWSAGVQLGLLALLLGGAVSLLGLLALMQRRHRGVLVAAMPARAARAVVVSSLYPLMLCTTQLAWDVCWMTGGHSVPEWSRGRLAAVGTLSASGGLTLVLSWAMARAAAHPLDVDFLGLSHAMAAAAFATDAVAQACRVAALSVFLCADVRLHGIDDTAWAWWAWLGLQVLWVPSTPRAHVWHAARSLGALGVFVFALCYAVWVVLLVLLAVAGGTAHGVPGCYTPDHAARLSHMHSLVGIAWSVFYLAVVAVVPLALAVMSLASETKLGAGAFDEALLRLVAADDYLKAPWAVGGAFSPLAVSLARYGALAERSLVPSPEPDPHAPLVPSQ